MEVGLSPGDFMLDGDPAPSPKGAEPPPNFRPISIVAKRLDASIATWYGCRPQPRALCVRWRPSSLNRIWAFDWYQKPVTLNDLERRNGRYFALFQRIQIASGRTA